MFGIMLVNVPKFMNHYKIKFLLKALKKITEIYKNPLVNDSNGANDCRELDNVIEKQLDHFNEFYNDEQNY